MKRCFYIDTPLGKLRVYAKHDIDCAADYPGVFIDLVKEETDGYGEMLCCVEYDSVRNRLQTVVYQPYVDDPEAIIVHDIEEEDES